jgi:hypothetical protein
MGKTQNKNSLLFLYEGETEGEFYKLIFDKYIPSREIRRNYGNLKGVYSLNEKVTSKIESYLTNPAFQSCNQIYVFVAYDREGTREVESQLDLVGLNKRYKVSRIVEIKEIVATQDLESWFFHDLEGIYKHLKVPNSQRNLNAYPNVEATNNRILSGLFHRYHKHYQKGKRVNGFLNTLDIGKIYDNVVELKEAIEFIKKLL